jgi:hypothetical protein
MSFFQTRGYGNGRNRLSVLYATLEHSYSPWRVPVVRLSVARRPCKGFRTVRALRSGETPGLLCRRLYGLVAGVRARLLSTLYRAVDTSGSVGIEADSIHSGPARLHVRFEFHKAAQAPPVHSENVFTGRHVQNYFLASSDIGSGLIVD